MIEYNHHTHIYSYQHKRYLSATQIVDLFQEPFDPIEASICYARKHGNTPEYWRKQWDTKRRTSLLRGDTVHSRQEEFLNTRMIDKVGSHILPVHNAERYPSQDYYDTLPDGVWPELKLWSHTWMIAGRADKVILRTDPSTSIRYADIVDYKSNEKIQQVSYQFRDGSYKWMKPPVGNLMDCNFWHYTLQLSLYMFMLETMGFTPGTITILHYGHPEQVGQPDPPPISYPVEYHKAEVIRVLNHIKRRKQHGELVT